MKVVPRTVDGDRKKIQVALYDKGRLEFFWISWRLFDAYRRRYLN